MPNVSAAAADLQHFVLGLHDAERIRYCEPGEYYSVAFCLQLLRQLLTLCRCSAGISMLEDQVMRSKSQILVSGLCWRCDFLENARDHTYRDSRSAGLGPQSPLRN